MSRNWKLCVLLVELRNGISTMENHMEVLKKIKDKELLNDPAISLLGIYIHNN